MLLLRDADTRNVRMRAQACFASGGLGSSSRLPKKEKHPDGCFFYGWGMLLGVNKRWPFRFFLKLRLHLLATQIRAMRVCEPRLALQAVDSDPHPDCKKKRSTLMGASLFWRTGWDSNPRYRKVQLISSQSRYDHFDTCPYAHDFACLDSIS